MKVHQIAAGVSLGALAIHLFSSAWLAVAGACAFVAVAAYLSDKYLYR